MEHFILYDEALTKFGSSIKDDLNYLLHSIDKHNLTVDQELIKKAFLLCCEIHKSERRASGVPYYTHPLSVALILIEELNINVTSVIVAALLHNILRCPGIDIKYIRAEFGQNVALLLARFFRIIKYTKTKRSGAEVLHLMFSLIIKDVRVFLLQLCNRLHDIRTLEYVSEQSQKVTAVETLNFYIPFAHKFGLTKMQHELESRAFYFYNRIQYQKNIDFLKIQKKFYSEYIFILMENIKSLLNKHNIGHSMKILHKQEYELFLQLPEIYASSEDNIFSLVVYLDIKSLDSIKACRKILDLTADNIKQNNFVEIFSEPVLEIDNSWTLELFMHNKKIRINMKADGTTDATRPEILNIISDTQIKYTDSQLSDEDIKIWSDWMKDIIETYSATKAEQLIWNSLKINLYNDKIVVHNLDVERYIMPKGSTALDFAFNVSYKIGIQAVTCKINGQVKGLFTELKTGDVVEIITSYKCRPDSNWLNHVVTFKAIAYLSKYFENKYQLSTNNNVVTQNLYQKFTIVCKESDITPLVQNVIGQDKIYRIAFANDMENHVISIATNIAQKENTNKLFVQLVGIKGIKMVSVSYQTW